MIRNRGSAWLCALAIAALACPAWAQPDAEQPGPDAEATAEAVDASPDTDLDAAPSPQEWVILTAVLGEQLPDIATLAEIRLNDDGAVSVEVIGETQAALIATLSPFFSTVQPETPRIAAPERAAVRVRGIPQTLNDYRALKGEEIPQQEAAAATGGSPAQPPEEVWPPLRVRRVFNQNEVRMAQLTLDGRDYIVREGSLFSNNAYRFVGMAVGDDGAPSEMCVSVERVASATRRTLCPEG